MTPALRSRLAGCALGLLFVLVLGGCDLAATLPGTWTLSTWQILDEGILLGDAGEERTTTSDESAAGTFATFTFAEDETGTLEHAATLGADGSVVEVEPPAKTTLEWIASDLDAPKLAIITDNLAFNQQYDVVENGGNKLVLRFHVRNDFSAAQAQVITTTFTLTR